MSAQEFKPGDRVEYVGHPKSGYVSDYLIGKYGTVARQENLSSDSVPVKWDHRPLAVDGVLALNIRLISAEPEDKDDLYVEPEPLKEGDWVHVWAQVYDFGDEDEPLVDIPTRHEGQSVVIVPRANTIVRPDAGQAPPWLEAEKLESEAIANIAEVLSREGDMDYDAASPIAASLYRAGVRITEGGAS